MLTRGATFLARLERSHAKIVEVSQPFLGAASRVLVHGKSRLVAGALAEVCKTRDIEVIKRYLGRNLLTPVSSSNLGCVDQIQWRHGQEIEGGEHPGQSGGGSCNWNRDA